MVLGNMAIWRCGIEQWKEFWPNFSVVWESEHRLEVQPKEIDSGEINTLAYQAWEQAGLLSIITTRLDKELVGYFVCVYMPYVNFTQHFCCFSMLYYVRKPWRGLGIGTVLLDKVESVAAVRGASAIFVGAKTDLPYIDFFRHKNYKPHELMLYKWLGD